jgi:hypothetical protein
VVFFVVGSICVDDAFERVVGDQTSSPFSTLASEPVGVTFNRMADFPY